MDKFDPEIIELIERKAAIKYFNTQTVVLCTRCSGTGSYTTEELTDYHRRDYDTVRHKCEACLGDGRLVQTKIELVLDARGPTVTQTPYAKFKGDPYKSHAEIYGIKVDRRNRGLESKHPELAAISYDKYDDLASQLYTLEVLKKDFKNG